MSNELSQPTMDLTVNEAKQQTYSVLMHLFVMAIIKSVFIWCVKFIEQRSSSWTLGERICAAFIPFIAVVEVLVWAVTDCFDFRRHFPRNRRQESRDIARLADETRCNIHP